MLGNDNDNTNNINSSTPINRPKEEKIGFIEAWFIPGVLYYAMSNAFIKFVSYSFLLWLPYYLTTGTILIIYYLIVLPHNNQITKKYF